MRSDVDWLQSASPYSHLADRHCLLKTPVKEGRRSYLNSLTLKIDTDEAGQNHQETLTRGMPIIRHKWCLNVLVFFKM